MLQSVGFFSFGLLIIIFLCLQMLNFNGSWLDFMWKPFFSPRYQFKNFQMINPNLAESPVKKGNNWIVKIGDSNTRYLYYLSIRYLCDHSVLCKIHVPFEKVNNVDINLSVTGTLCFMLSKRKKELGRRI